MKKLIVIVVLLIMMMVTGTAKGEDFEDFCLGIDETVCIEYDGTVWDYVEFPNSYSMFVTAESIDSASAYIEVYSPNGDPIYETHIVHDNTYEAVMTELLERVYNRAF